MRAGNRSEDIDLRSSIAPNPLSRLREMVRVRAAFDLAVVVGLKSNSRLWRSLPSPQPNPLSRKRERGYARR